MTDYYGDLAAELHRIADTLTTVAGGHRPRPYVSLDIQPGGDTDKLFASLQRLLGLPEETRVYPGHNYGPTPTSTIGHEALTNPYLLCDSPAAFRALRERRR